MLLPLIRQVSSSESFGASSSAENRSIGGLEIEGGEGVDFRDVVDVVALC